MSLDNQNRAEMIRLQNTKPDYQIQERYLNFIQIE